jgi:Cof subfamily protein (haloacid dehalogenase superfamily)
LTAHDTFGVNNTYPEEPDVDFTQQEREQFKQVKVVFFDLDGTMINNRLELEQETIDAVNLILARGITPIIATGRSFEAAWQFLRRLHPHYPIICYNGAVIYADEGRQKLHEFTLDDEIARMVIELGREYELHTHGFFQGRLLYEEHSSDGDRYQNHGGLKAEIVNFDLMESLNFTKMMYVSDDRASILAAASRLDELFAARLSHYFSLPHFYEMVSGKVGKERAASILLDDLGLKPNQAMAFGDGHNDIGLLRYVGTGVAMGNSEQEVRLASDYVAPDNDDFGVARFLDAAFGLDLFNQAKS